MFTFFTRQPSVIIVPDQCLICDMDIGRYQKKIKCNNDECHYHKKCFKRNVAYENDRAMDMGYKGLTKWHNTPCDCGNKVR